MQVLMYLSQVGAMYLSPMYPCLSPRPEAVCHRGRTGGRRKEAQLCNERPLLEYWQFGVSGSLPNSFFNQSVAQEYQGLLPLR